MRAAVGLGVGPIARQLIALDRRENESYASPAAQDGGTREYAHGGYLTAAAGLPGRGRPKNVKGFIDACTPKQRAALAALMLLGREPLGTTAADVEAVVETFAERRDLGQHLASKGRLSEFLERALDLLGL